ncbi:MAG: hypothetical protein HY226_01130 [Candidatus Vogelbacteria bacterium]|nr:hypothetical protein [Candidatus Vogelbacteria bacterium]
MAIKPNGFQFSSGPIDQDGGTIQGGVCATEEEARQSLKEACEEFVRNVTKETTMVYAYGEGENQHVTRVSVPEPPEGYRAVVSQGMDHNEGEYEEFFAVPLGTTIMPRQNGEWLNHLHFKLQGEILWISWWDVMDVVLPKGTLEFNTEDGWIPLQDWRRQKS